MTTAQQIKVRESLILDNLGRIERNLRNARRHGDLDPTVLVMDLDDARARALAEALGDPAAVAAHAAGGRRQGVKPAVFCGLPRAAVVDLLRDQFPELAAVVAVAETGGGYLAVAVAAGGAAAVVLREGEAPGGAPAQRVLIP